MRPMAVIAAPQTKNMTVNEIKLGKRSTDQPSPNSGIRIRQTAIRLSAERTNGVIGTKRRFFGLSTFLRFRGFDFKETSAYCNAVRSKRFFTPVLIYMAILININKEENSIKVFAKENSKLSGENELVVIERMAETIEPDIT